MSEDMLNVMGGFISTELDAFENLHKELEENYKEIERLNNIIKAKDEGIKALTEDLCEESIKIEKAIEYIKEQTVDVEMNIYGMPPTIKSFRGNTERLLEILKGEDKD